MTNEQKSSIELPETFKKNLLQWLFKCNWTNIKLNFSSLTNRNFSIKIYNRVTCIQYLLHIQLHIFTYFTLILVFFVGFHLMKFYWWIDSKISVLTTFTLSCCNQLAITWIDFFFDIACYNLILHISKYVFQWKFRLKE